MAYTEYLDQVQEAYLAYYQRPADPAGLVYWAQRLEAKGGNLNDLINEFAHSEESTELYGPINNETIGTVVEAFYQAMFDRAPDAEGKAFYVDGFKDGKFTAGSIALDIINGAQNDDAVAIMNKMQAANYFTKAIDPDMNGEAPFMVTYNGDDEEAAREWLASITADPLTRKTEGQVVSDMKEAIADAGDPILGVADGYTLTEGTDIAVANIFTAPRGWTPGGTDQMNTLNDDDVLTGSGTNPTLNFTYVNDADAGDYSIMPELKGIETINVNFSTNAVAVTTLDLQDSFGVKNVNLSRIDDGQTAVIDNITEAETNNLSISDSMAPTGNAQFTYLADALSGADDEATLELMNAQLNSVLIEENNGVPTEGFETLNLVSSESSNAIGTLQTEDLKSLIITGDKSLRLGATAATFNPLGTPVEATNYARGLNNVAGSLDLVDASALTADFTYHIGNEINAFRDDTSGVQVNLTVKGGTGDDNFILTAGASVNAGDVLEGGEGGDMMVMLAGTSTISGEGNIKGVENLEIRAGHDNEVAVTADAVTIDADAFTDLAAIYIRNEGQNFNAVTNRFESIAEGMTVTLNDLTAAQAKAITVAHGTTGNSSIANNIVNMAFKTAGTANEAQVTLIDGVNTNPVFNLQLNANSAELVTLVDNDTESNTVHLIDANRAQADSKLTILPGDASDAGKYMNLDSLATGAVLVNQVANVVNVLNATDYVAQAGYGLATDGNSFSNTIHLDRESAEQVALGGIAFRDASASSVYYGNAAAAPLARHTFENVDASTYAGDVIIRFAEITRADGLKSMDIKTGTGNDTLIFDALNAKNAGYTSGDTIAAGTGTDTLLIDGNNATSVVLNKSEWDNTKGIDVLRLGGNVGVANGGNMAIEGTDTNLSGYSIEIDDDFVKQTDTGNNLTIINNDGDRSAYGESDAIINLRALAQTSNVTFIGANGEASPIGALFAGISSNRLQLSDNSANQANILDGGDTDITTVYAATAAGDAAWNAAFSTVAGQGGNNNVLQIFNESQVTVSDLSQTKNFGRIEATNDEAVARRMYLELNNTVLDQLVDSSHTATTNQVERLFIMADNNPNVAGAVMNMTISAGTASSAFGLDILLDRGTNNIITGTSGADQVMFLGNYTAAQAAAYADAGIAVRGANAAAVNNAALIAEATGVDYTGADGIAGTVDDVLVAYTGTYTLGANDEIEVFGGVDLTGATIPAGTTIIAHSSIKLTAAQYATVNSIQFVGNVAHGLQITNNTDATPEVAPNLNKITFTTAGSSATLTTGNEVGAPTGTPVGGTVSGGGVTPPAGTIVLTPGTTAPVAATDAADVFSFDVAAAKALTADTQISITGFNVAADSLKIDSTTAAGVTTLDQLNGVDGISVQTNAITGETLINFGADLSGDVIAVTLVGITNAALVNIEVI